MMPNVTDGLRFKFDLKYSGKMWTAECKWLEGEDAFSSVYGYDRVVCIEAAGKTAEAAVETLISRVEELLSTTAERVRKSFSGFNTGYEKEVGAK